MFSSISARIIKVAILTFFITGFHASAETIALNGTWYTGSPNDPAGTPSLSTRNSDSFVWGTDGSATETAQKGILWSYFAPQELVNDGDSITLSYTVTPLDSSATGYFWRFGLFNSGGTKVEHDLVGLNTDDGFLDTMGYLSTWDQGSAGTDVFLYARTGGKDNPLSSTSLVEEINHTTVSPTLQQGIPYVMSFTLTRNSATEYFVAAAIGNKVISGTTTNINMTSFDMFGILNTPTGIDRFTFSNFIINNTGQSLPGAAYNPHPVDTATEVSVIPELSLSWTAGYGSDSHDVYFGNDYNGVLNADIGSIEYYKGNQTEITFTPPSLELNTTYFWRIDEVNQYGRTSGAVWSFTTDDNCGYWGYSQMDFNSDCVVNLIDFAYLSSVWMDLDMVSDLNYDGSTDNLDIGLFTSDWLTSSLVNKPGSRNYEPSVPIVKLADVTYKNTVDKNSNPVALKMYSRWQPQTITEPLPAIVLFFGGGWSSKNIGQFEEYCKYFAAMGIICMAPDYRVSSVEGTSPYQAVTDAKSAVRWVRANAASLNIDPDRIIVGGGSAGGHIAACTEIINGYDEPGEDLSVSSRANLLYLLNPVVDTTPAGYGSGRFTPATWEDLSPVHHVTPGVCPTIVFHGTADTTVPFENVERFTQTMHDNGNVCKLVPFPGKKHSFFNHISFKPQMDPADFDVCVEVGFNFFIINDFIDGL